MFLKRKKSQRFGASSFSKVSPHAKKIPLQPLGRSYSNQKKHFAIGCSSERIFYHTDLFRFVLPISYPSALNFSQFVRFQNSPKLSKIEKIAETCEFDGKEPLFVERTIAISLRVLGGTQSYKNGKIALLLTTSGLMCSKHVSQKRNTVGAIIIGDWNCGGARTIYFQWRKAGRELIRVADTEKKRKKRGWQPQVAETRGRSGCLQRRVTRTSFIRRRVQPAEILLTFGDSTSTGGGERPKEFAERERARSALVAA